MKDLISQYHHSRLGIIQSLARNLAQERILDEETRAKFRFGGFPKWYATYYEETDRKTAWEALQHMMASWEFTDFRPSPAQQKIMSDAQKTLKLIGKLRRDRALLRSMQNEISFALVSMIHRYGGAIHRSIEADAKKLVKTRTSPIEYLESLADTSDEIERHRVPSERAQEAYREMINILSGKKVGNDLIYFLARWQGQLSYSQLAAATGVTKDTVAQYMELAEAKLKRWLSTNTKQVAITGEFDDDVDFSTLLEQKRLVDWEHGIPTKDRQLRLRQSETKQAAFF